MNIDQVANGVLRSLKKKCRSTEELLAFLGRHVSFRSAAISQAEDDIVDAESELDNARKRLSKMEQLYELSQRMLWIMEQEAAEKGLE